MAKPKEYLPWFLSFMRMEARERQRAVDDMMAHLKKEDPKLHKALKNGQLEIVGVMPCVSYAQIKPKSDEYKNALFTHPWGTPMLLCKVKGKSALMIVGNGIKFNESLVGPALGITG